MLVLLAVMFLKDKEHDIAIHLGKLGYRAKHELGSQGNMNILGLEITVNPSQNTLLKRHECELPSHIYQVLKQLISAKERLKLEFKLLSS